MRRQACKFVVYKSSARTIGRSFRHLIYSKSIIYISFPVRYFRRPSEESSVRSREDIIALNYRRLPFASSQNFIFSLSVVALLRTSQHAPGPMLKLAVMFRSPGSLIAQFLLSEPLDYFAQDSDNRHSADSEYGYKRHNNYSKRPLKRTRVQRIHFRFLLAIIIASTI